MRPLIIGFGNPLREDDGIGWRAAETVEARTGAGKLDVITCHALTPELAGQVSRACVTLFLDAAVGTAPGDADCVGVRPENPGPWSHHLTPAQLSGLALALTGEPPCAFLITGGIHRMGWSECLTPAGAIAAGRVADRALALLRHAGFA